MDLKTPSAMGPMDIPNTGPTEDDQSCSFANSRTNSHVNEDGATSNETEHDDLYSDPSNVESDSDKNKVARSLVESKTSEENIANPQSNEIDTHKDENTVHGPSKTNNSDMLSLEYVHVDQVPEKDSEEIRNLTNQPSTVGGYFGYMPNILSLSFANYFPGWLCPAVTGSESNQSQNMENFNSWLKENIPGVYDGSIEEEQMFRNCLVQAISDHFVGIKDADTQLFAESFFTQAELDYARENKSQCSRRILLMLLRRDTKTMLSQLHALRTSEETIVQETISSLRRYLEMGLMRRRQCVRCLLKKRVSICLIADDLPKCDSELLSFVNDFSEERQPAQPSVSERLWTELFKVFESHSLCARLVQHLISVIGACGYHSDIVRMLNYDVEMDRNSFTCRCQEMLNDQDVSHAMHQDHPISREQQEANNSRSRTNVVANPISGTVVLPETHPHVQSLSHTAGCAMAKYQDSADTGYDGKRKDTNVMKRSQKETIPSSTLKRKQRYGENANENLKRRPPEVPDLFEKKRRDANDNSGGNSKRKAVSVEHELSAERLGNSNVNEHSEPNIGNCDLQMQMLKTGVPAFDNGQQDSVGSWRSNGSDKDSGVYEQPTMISGMNVDKEETARKEIDCDLKISSSERSSGENMACELVNTTVHETINTQFPSSQSGLFASCIDSDTENMTPDNSHSPMEQEGHVSNNDFDEYSVMNADS